MLIAPCLLRIWPMCIWHFSLGIHHHHQQQQQHRHHHHHHHHVVWLTTDPQPLSKAVLQRVRTSAPCLNFLYLLVSLRSSSNCLNLLPRLSVHSILPPITCFRRQFLCKLWPIQEPSFVLLYVGYSFPPWLFVMLLNFSHSQLIFHMIGPTDLLHSPTPNIESLRTTWNYILQHWPHVPEQTV